MELSSPYVDVSSRDDAIIRVCDNSDIQIRTPQYKIMIYANLEIILSIPHNHELNRSGILINFNPRVMINGICSSEFEFGFSNKKCCLSHKEEEKVTI